MSKEQQGISSRFRRSINRYNALMVERNAIGFALENGIVIDSTIVNAVNKVLMDERKSVDPKKYPFMEKLISLLK